MMLMFNILFLLAAIINVSSFNIRGSPASIHHGKWTKTNFNIRGDPASIHHGKWTKSRFNIRRDPGSIHHGTAPKSHFNIRGGPASIHHGTAPKSHFNIRGGPASIHHGQLTKSNFTLEWEGSPMNVKNCPLGCYCAIKWDPNFPKFMLKLVVENCTSDPVDELPQLFNAHKDVVSLELNNCHLSSLPQDLLKLYSLNVLYLIRNEFRAIPSQLEQLPVLQALYLEANKAEHLRLDNITRLSKLEALELFQSRIVALPDGIGNMTSLELLNVSRNNLRSLPAGIAALSKLLLLDLGQNEFETFPGEIANLTKLISLHLDHNKIKTVPSTIGDLTDLQVLVLRGNKIKTLPDDIRKLNDLKLLRLDENLLDEVPPVPTMRLSVLWLKQNSIKTVRCEPFTYLERLELSYNDLRSFDCGDNNHHLLQLDLSHNALDKLSCYYGMEYITHLDLSYNDISTLPADCTPFSVLGDLDTLKLDFNKIRALNFQQFCSYDFKGAFRSLSFRNNMISSIQTNGSDLISCVQTEGVIDLSNNIISTLDSWPMLLADKKPIHLNLTGNNLSEFSNSSGIFSPPFPSGTTFLLQKNQIKKFMDIFDGWEIVVNTTKNLNTLLTNIYFDLGANPLVCDCVDYKVYRYIQTLKTKRYDNLKCHEPLSLSGQNPRHIPLGNFVCEFDVNCPNGCACINIPHLQSINVTCRDYNQTEIPDMVPNLPHENYGYRIDISHQKLNKITSRPYLQKATEIFLSNNSITAVKINSSMTFFRVKILHLDNNRLQRLPESVASITDETNAVEVRLGGNPWVCDCEAMAMKNWILLNPHIVKDHNSICCHSPPSMVGVKVKDIERSMVCPNENKTAVYVVAAISSVVLVVIVYLAINDGIKYANWRFVGSDECDGERKEFDVFMCSCSEVADSEYVENYLIPELERRDFRVCYHREHFHGGKPIHVNMSEAIEKSKRTLAFFSNNFRKSGYSMFEFHSAFDIDVQNNTRRLITIKDTDLDMKKLDIFEVHYFQTHTYIAREDVKFWKLLEGSLPRKRLGRQVRMEGY